MAMKRPVVVLMLALILGEVLAVTRVHVAVFMICVPIFLLQRIITKKWNVFLVVIFLCCFLGYCVMGSEKDKADYMHSLEEKNVTVVGIYEKNIETAYGYQYYLENTEIYLEGENSSIHLRKIIIYSEEKPEFKVGNKIVVKGKMQQFNEARNYGNFDAKEYYQSLGVYANVKEQETQVIGKSCYFFRNHMQILREELDNALRKICNENNKGIFRICDENKRGIFCAIILGDKSDLPEDTKNMYQVNGISHLLAISGLHISTIGICIFQLFRKKFKFILSSGVSMMIVLGFVFLSGNGISSIRACGMFTFYLISQMIGRKYDMLNAISFVAIAVCLNNPFIVFHSAFQMSFGAMLAIILVYPVINGFFGLDSKKKMLLKEIRKRKYIRERARLIFKNIILGIAKSMIFSISIQLVLIPILAFNYFEICCYGTVLNIIVIPLMSVVLISAIGAASGYVILSFMLSVIRQYTFNGMLIFMTRMMVMPACVVLEFYEKLCDVFSKIPGNIFVTGKPAVESIVIYYIVLTVGLVLTKRMMEKRRKNKESQENKIPIQGQTVEISDKKSIMWKGVLDICKIVTVITAMLSLVLLVSYHVDDKLQILFYDVGQGDGIVIRKKDFVIMVDGGSSDVKAVGKYRIESALKACRVQKIDYEIITHADTDHISGVLEMLEKESADRIIIENLLLPIAIIRDENFELLMQAAAKAGTKVQYIKKGDYIQTEGLMLECIHPVKGFESNERNNYSTVLDVKYGSFKMLLTGDISAGEEKEFLDETDGRYTVLKVAHHGSKYSTTEEFLAQLTPGFSIISCGVDNRYGHPHAELLERLENADSNILRTDLSGQITVSTDGEEMKVEGFLK